RGEQHGRNETLADLRGVRTAPLKPARNRRSTRRTVFSAPTGWSANMSSTTTRIDPTAPSVNAHRTMPKLSSISPADRSDDTQPAADSSTSTAKQPEPPHNGQPVTNSSASTRLLPP